MRLARRTTLATALMLISALGPDSSASPPPGRARSEESTTYCLQSAQFKNHTLYWPVPGPCEGMPTIELTDDEMALLVEQFSYYADVQGWLMSLQPDPAGLYCMAGAPFLDGELVWLFEGCGPTEPHYDVTPAQYAIVVGGFDAMDAAQTFIRSKML